MHQNRATKDILWVSLLLICAGVILYNAYSDRVSGAIYAQDAGAMGMGKGDVERYRLFALAHREHGLEVPSPAKWAKDRFETLEFRPGSELEMLADTVWRPALEDERKAATEAAQAASHN